MTFAIGRCAIRRPLGRIYFVSEDRGMDAAIELQRMLNGYQVSQAIHVAVVLRLSDVLAEGPRTSAELAAASGADDQSLRRLLHALTLVGLYTCDSDGRFANTELGAALRSDAPQSVAAWGEFIGRPYHWLAWASLEHSVRTGENAFRAVHGMSVWEYRREHPDEAVVFDRAMTAQSGIVADAITRAYDFSGSATVVDVGGGRGGLLAAILARYPSVRGVLFDQPDVVAGAGELLAAAYVADRCSMIGGSFFDAVPDGGDTYLLKAVIHDWPDAEAVEIMRTCRRAVPVHGTLLLVEQLLDDGPDARRTAFSDLNMLVATGGQERTVDEYRSLLTAASFRLDRVVSTDSNVFILEATPA
jgi:O-methyltransferase domain/Dimerisation domain